MVYNNRFFRLVAFTCVFVIAILLSPHSAMAQSFETKSDTIVTKSVTFEEFKTSDKGDIKIFFRINSSQVELEFEDNEKSISQLDSIMSRGDLTIGLDSLVLVATASIDGVERRNSELAQRRAESVREFLVSRYPQLSDMPFKSTFTAEDWQGLRQMVEADTNFQHKSEVLRIIDDSKRSADNKEWYLKTMRGGETWSYLKKYILPKLRYGASVLFYYNIEKREKILYHKEIVVDTIPIVRDSSNFIIAIKTNLLYDVALTPNIELEIPIGDRLSLSAEYIFPWWGINKRNYTQRASMGHLSLTYWLGDRVKRDRLTGWNVTLFGGYGNYDLQLFKSKGVQGDIINTGLSLGYAHKLSKNFHLHYQLGLGYTQSDYKSYTKMWDTEYGDVKIFDYPWETKRYKWIGPTQAEVSLVWILNI